MKTMLLILIALFASCAVLTAQDAKQSDSHTAKAGDRHSQQGQKTADKPALTPQLQDETPAGPAAPSSGPSLLKGTGRSSVEDAARKAAHDLAAAGQNGSPTKSGDVAKDAAKPPTDASNSSVPSEIGEFHAVPEGTSRTSADPKVQKEDSPGKRIHGELYGAGGRAGRAGSESVRATSKSGKTSVYVQSGQAASSVAPPQ